MTKTKWSVRVPLILGLVAVIALVAFIGGWGTQTKIAGAIVANGMIQVETNRQVVQHPDGGVVGQILASDGDTVNAGDIVLRLDDTFLQSELTIIESQLYELISRRVRLESERDGTVFQDIDEPTNLILAELLAGQKQLFTARLESLMAEKNQYAEPIKQTQAQITGLRLQETSLMRQKSLIEQERADNEDLLTRGLTTASGVLALQRAETQITGDLGLLIGMQN